MSVTHDELSDKYNLSEMKLIGKGKYSQKYNQGTNIIHLDSDVAIVFHDDKSVNKALRSLIEIAKNQIPSN